MVKSTEVRIRIRVVVIVRSAMLASFVGLKPLLKKSNLQNQVAWIGKSKKLLIYIIM